MNIVYFLKILHCLFKGSLNFPEYIFSADWSVIVHDRTPRDSYTIVYTFPYSSPRVQLYNSVHHFLQYTQSTVIQQCTSFPIVHQEYSYTIVYIISYSTPRVQLYNSEYHFQQFTQSTCIQQFTPFSIMHLEYSYTIVYTISYNAPRVQNIHVYLSSTPTVQRINVYLILVHLQYTDSAP